MIRGETARAGLYECADCRRQFTVTTKTPLHATKLPLWKWVQVLWLMLWSSKGVSSVVVARWTGVSQKTAWKICHAARELMDKHQEMAPALQGIVEIDDKYLGGAPRFKRGVTHKRGKGTAKPQIVVAASRDGFVRSRAIERDSVETLRPFVEQYIDRSAYLMSDGGGSYQALGSLFRRHDTVNHGRKEFARGPVHSNTAESFASYLERILIGVYHRMSRWQLQRYVAEATFRWNAKCETMSEDGDPTGKFEKIPPLQQLEMLFRHAVGCQIRGTRVGGIKRPGEVEPLPRRPIYRQRWMQRHASSAI